MEKPQTQGKKTLDANFTGKRMQYNAYQDQLMHISYLHDTQSRCTYPTHSTAKAVPLVKSATHISKTHLYLQIFANHASRTNTISQVHKLDQWTCTKSRWLQSYQRNQFNTLHSQDLEPERSIQPMQTVSQTYERSEDRLYQGSLRKTISRV